MLRKEGRLIVSDIVAGRTFSEEMRGDLDSWAHCVAGAQEQSEYLGTMKKAGFGDIRVVSNREFYVEDRGSKEQIKFLSITVRSCKHD